MISFLGKKTSNPAETVEPWHILAPDKGESDWSIELLARCMRSRIWSPIIYREPYRREANFLATQVLALDYDDGITIDESKNIFAEYAYIMGTTKSHMKDKNGITCERFRVLLFLDFPIFDKDKAKQFMAWAVKEFKSDRACKDLARFFFPCTEIVEIKSQGLRFKWRDVILDTPHVADVEQRTYSLRSMFEDRSAPIGSRNKTVFATACKLISFKLDKTHILSRLRNISNGLTDAEIERCYNNALKSIQK